MSYLAALFLFGTPAAATPSVQDLLLDATPNLVLKANGYAEGFALARSSAYPPIFFT